MSFNSGHSFQEITVHCHLTFQGATHWIHLGFDAISANKAVFLSFIGCQGHHSSSGHSSKSSLSASLIFICCSSFTLCTAATSLFLLFFFNVAQPKHFTQEATPSKDFTVHLSLCLLFFFGVTQPWRLLFHCSSLVLHSHNVFVGMSWHHCICANSVSLLASLSSPCSFCCRQHGRSLLCCHFLFCWGSILSSAIHCKLSC